MPKNKNIKTGENITFGLLPSQKKQLEREAEQKDISVANLMRNKLFPRKSRR